VFEESAVSNLLRWRRAGAEFYEAGDRSALRYKAHALGDVIEKGVAFHQVFPTKSNNFEGERRSVANGRHLNGMFCCSGDFSVHIVRKALLRASSV
jgi:hypothetical protein